MSVYEESLKMHEKYHGKLSVETKVPLPCFRSSMPSFVSSASALRTVTRLT